MNSLGICEYNSGATLIDNNKNIYAINEERLNRVKLYDGFPIKSIKKILEISGLKKDDINFISIDGNTSNYPRITNFIKHIKLNKHNLFWLPIRYAHELNIKKRTNEFRENSTKKLKNLFLNAKFINKIEHHLSHAASAYYTSGWDKTLVVTMDGWGDNSSNRTYITKNNELKLLYRSSELDSLGYVYGRTTAALGFRPGRHEGKITGLAAYGKEIKSLKNKLNKFIKYDENKKCFKSNIGKYYIPMAATSLDRGIKNKIIKLSLKNFKNLVSKYKREDVANTVQIWLEEITVKYIQSLVDNLEKNNIALAGGVFSNVKLNQRIKEVDGIKNIFIHPNMSDAGLCFGNAILTYNKKIDKLNKKIDTVYFGPSYSNKEIEEELKRNKLKYTYYEEIEKEIASLLAKGKVVARFNGAMEYGPRALGNRSILYQATDPTVNDWLNKKLKRTEFMPFAPVTAMEDASKCYKDIKGAEQAAKFMTITFDCTDYMKKNMPAVVHIDGTARPQLIVKKDNTSYYKILKEYKKLTGLPSIINTSFNMHEEPIVCTPSDAIRSFKSGHLDYLAIGDYLVKN